MLRAVLAATLVLLTGCATAMEEGADEEAIGANAEALEWWQGPTPMTGTGSPLEPPPFRRPPARVVERPKAAVKPVIPLTRGAVVLGQIAACRKGSNAEAMRCMAEVLRGQGG